jgi:hypothetical protein
MQTISPVNIPHPTKDLIASGSSRAVYIWRGSRPMDAAQLALRGGQDPWAGVGGGGLG